MLKKYLAVTPVHLVIETGKEQYSTVHFVSERPYATSDEGVQGGIEKSRRFADGLIKLVEEVNSEEGGSSGAGTKVVAPKISKAARQASKAPAGAAAVREYPDVTDIGEVFSILRGEYKVPASKMTSAVEIFAQADAHGARFPNVPR
jgi:hypothetical protein